ncbi:MAG TPA: hypothetical protein VFQ25_16205 [Ktedonobacterales bacterium]|nr:hypothetical protein [Ktedonobacterales bacterium]
MTEARAPLARVRLIDGRELLIEPDAVRVGERTHLISWIEEARMLFLRPETIGLRMKDVGLVEYSVARPGDGQLALEAIYQLRPDLRRPDLPPPAPEAPPGYEITAPAPPEPFGPAGTGALPPVGRPAAPPPGAFPPPGAYPYPLYPPPPPPGPEPFPPPVAQAYGPEPNRRYATLTPQPRGAARLIGATFRLAGRRFGPLFALALVVALLPNLALGGLTVAISLLSGEDPFVVTPNPLGAIWQAASGQAPAVAATPTDSLVGLLSLLSLVAGLIMTGWMVAALTLAARDAALGRPISVAGCAREGLRRLWPTLSALIITNVALLVVAFPGLVFSLGLVLAVVAPPVGAAPLPAGATPVAIVMAAGTALVTLALLAWLWPRLALAPTAAALGMFAPVRTGWTLARGGAGRIFAALLAVGVVTALFTAPAEFAQFYSTGLAALALIPIAQLIAAPLSALVRTLALYDQRLRREGYALFEREGIAPPDKPMGRALDPVPDHD